VTRVSSRDSPRPAAETATVMIKLVYCITRRRGMTLDEFSRYWREVHGPIGQRIPGLRRLVQSHPVPHPPDMVAPAFDGMAELWFDNLAALQAARDSAEWRASSLDEANFIDETRTALFLTKEYEIAGP
jgi:uncharacterized protein (TIGR02118 family)